MRNNKLISIVVPMFNEEEGLHNFIDVLFQTLNNCQNYSFEIVCVNDGSKDNTLELLKKEQEEHCEIVVVNLSRNFGHESAVAAGLNVAKGEAVIPMDADLQDPPELIPQLLIKFEEGFDVVNAKRESRKDDTAFKRNTAALFYKIIKKWSGKINVEENVGHYRLMSRRVVDKVNELNDYVRVLRVEVPYVGYKTTSIGFVRAPRTLGKTHYNLKSMSNLAIDSIVSTTSTPLKMIKGWAIGIGIIALLSSISELVLFILTLLNVVALSQISFWGWLVINVFLIGTTFILLSNAIMAEYEARLYLEVQHRPFYIIESVSKK